MRLLTAFLFLGIVSATPMLIYRASTEEDSTLSAKEESKLSAFPANDDPRWQTAVISPRALTVTHEHPPLPQDASYEYICESGEFAPLSSDVLSSAFELLHTPLSCLQENALYSKCKRLSKQGTASVGLCGKFRSRVFCPMVGSALSSMVKNCQALGNTGGYIKMHKDYKISVYHS